MKLRNILVENAGSLQLLAILGLPIALLIACVVAIIISLVWGILAFVGLILVFVGGYAVVKGRQKVAMPIIILGIVLILCSTTLGLEIGTFNFADLPLFKEVL
jgi:ABC-type Fe3+-siderophore transport system permease subunit